MGLKEYNDELDRMEQGARAGDGLTRSLSVVSDTNPDDEAQREELSRRTGIPAAWVPEFKEEVSRRAILASPTVQNLPREAPKTTAWLSDRNNARLAHDDIETLAGIEGIVDMLGRGAPDLGGAPSAFVRGLKAAPSRLSTGLAETGDILFTPFLREGARITGSELLADLARAPRIATDYWRAEADRIAGKNKPGTAAAYAGQIGESVGSSVLSMPFGIGGQGAALTMFGLGSEGGYRKTTDAGYSEPYAALLALSTKAMEGITEKMGLDVLYNPEKIARPAFRVALEFLAGELGGEEVNTLWEAAKDKLTLEPGMTVAEVAARVVDTAIVTVGAAGAQGVAAHYAARAADRIGRNAEAVRNRELMAALGEAAVGSKLLKRLPDKAREFVEHVTAEGPVQNVFVPAEEWTTYFQEKKIDPAAMAEEVLGDRAQYEEALATGADLVIPLGRYVSMLAGTEHHAGLAQDLRLRQGEMTAREEKTYREGLSARLTELSDQGAAEETPQGSDRQVYDDVLAQLTAAGQAPDVAAREATLWQVRYRTRAARLGVDPYELYRERKVRITASPAEAPGLEASPEGVPEGATLSQGAVPPEGFPAEQEGFTYDGTYEGTGVHQYTDRNPDSPTYRDTIAVKAPEQLAGKIEGIRKRRELGQPGRTGEPLATLTGKELGEFGDDVKALRTAAAAWYRENLQETFVEREDLGEIRFSGKGRKEFVYYGANPDKLRMIVALKSLIENGDYIRREEINKPRRDKIVAFHVIEGNVALSGETHRARVLIAEDRDGKLFYQLFPDAKEADERKASGRVPGAKSGPSTTPEGGGTTLDQSVLPDDDGVNLRLLPQEEGGGRRGFIRFGSGGEVEIGLLETADLSTFLHETGHAFLEELRSDAGAEGASQQIRDDWNLIASHLGIAELAPGAAIPQGSHETFARSFEAYLMEGKAPSPELASAFARFKAWLVQVYREISRLNVTLTPEVRGVFDRLVATDEEIAAAERKLSLQPQFASAEEADMTDAEFTAYSSEHALEAAESRERLDREGIAEYAREKTARWKEEWDRVRVGVEEEANKNPVFQVYHLLTRGELPDGSAPATPIRLSRKAFVEAYGQAFVDTLPPKWFRKMTAKDGMHPDLVAEMFGFGDGAEMIRRLQEAPPREEWIRKETDRRMKETHGDLVNDGSIAEAAIDAVHSDRTGRRLWVELRALRRKDLAHRATLAREERPTVAQQVETIQRDLRRSMVASIPPIAAFREAAKKAIDAKSVMSLRPDLYLRAEEKAGRLAFEAAAKGQEKAGEEKKKQLLSHYLYLEGRKAQEDVDGIYRYVHGLMDTPAQERIGKAGSDFLDQVNALLEQYEFKQVSNKAIEERRSLVEWAQAQEAQGLEPDIPPVILYNARQVNYRELKLNQLRDLRDALKNIEHLARQQGRLLGDQANVSFNEAVTGLVASLLDNVGPGKKSPIDRETRNAIERAGNKLTQFHVALLKAEQFVEWADGKDIGGAWNAYIFQPIADAQAAEGDLTMRVTKLLAELFDGYARDLGGVKALREKIPIEGLGEALTRQAIVAAALNTGNEGNLDKLLGGRSWNEEKLQEVLSHLTARDWKFVQQTWDLIDSMWPEIAALQKRMTGVTPKKVPAREFTVTTGDGETVTLKGGYYPAVYDPEKSAAGAKQVDATGERLFEGAYVRAATEKGHTKERTSYRGPILLSLEVIPQHFATVIHDLTHREAIVQAWRLLQNPAVRETITETMGAPYHRMLNLWLASVATDRQAPPTGTDALNRMIDRLRMNATIVAMGFKFTTVVAQALDIVQSFRRVKGKHLAKAFARFVSNPVEARRFVQEKSGEMRHRERNLDRDLRDLGRQLLGKKGILPRVQRTAMRGIAIVDMAASVPTWLGAYDQALDQGLSETDAIHWADRQVRLSNPAGGAKDLAAVQRKESVWKLFTMFYSYFNVMYNAQADVARSSVRRLRGEETPSARDPLAVGKFTGGELAIGALAMWVVPALAGELLAGRGPDDDEEEWRWILRKLALFPFLSLPGIRDIANAVESGREYQMTPVAGVFAAAARTAQRVGQVAEDEREPEDLILPAVDLLGYSVGLPTGQAKITGRYVWDLMEGETPDSAGEFMRNMVFYRKRK